MHYRLLPFDHTTFLIDLVHDIYELRTTTESHTYSTVPNGIIGLTIVLEGNSEVWSKGAWVSVPGVSIYGLVKKPGVIRVSPGFREIAIGFRPYFLQLFLSESMSHLTGDVNTDAGELFDGNEIEKLVEMIQRASSDGAIVAAIEHFFMAQFIQQKQDKRLLEAINLLYSHQFSTVESLSNQLNISTTSLRNLFRDRIGQSPKEVMKILRIHQALKTNPDSYASLTDLALGLGYFDQAHFVHDFKKVLNMSPRQYFGNDKLSFDFYNYGRWEGNIFAQK